MKDFKRNGPPKTPPPPIPGSVPFPPVRRVVTPEQFKRVAEVLAMELKRVAEQGKDVEGFLLCFHTIKAGRLYHRVVAQDFPTGDWGACVIRIGSEGHRAQTAGATAIASAS